MAAYARRHGGIRPEDLEDLVAEKALDLVRRIDSGLWKLGESTPGEVVNFVHRVARNGVVDLFRKGGRRRAAEPALELVEAESMGSRVAPVDSGAETRSFAEALADCAARLDTRSRKIWFFRVFLEMSSRSIAIHPDINLNAGHVDVLVSRARNRIRECMKRKGQTEPTLDPALFAEVWIAVYPEPVDGRVTKGQP